MAVRSSLHQYFLEYKIAINQRYLSSFECTFFLSRDAAGRNYHKSFFPLSCLSTSRIIHRQFRCSNLSKIINRIFANEHYDYISIADSSCELKTFIRSCKSESMTIFGKRNGWHSDYSQMREELYN